MGRVLRGAPGAGPLPAVGRSPRPQPVATARGLHPTAASWLERALAHEHHVASLGRLLLVLQHLLREPMHALDGLVRATEHLDFGGRF